MSTPKRSNVFRQLRAGDDVPPGTPRRYRTGHGYIRLRWKVGPYEYVEAYEHRFVAGLDAPQVHHVNRQKDDNSPANLQPITEQDHHAAHAGWDIAEACDLYRAGWSLPRLALRYGVDTSRVLRALRRRGVQMRTLAEAWKFRKAPVSYPNMDHPVTFKRIA